jgi:hypothetical protein
MWTQMIGDWISFLDLFLLGFGSSLNLFIHIPTRPNEPINVVVSVGTHCIHQRFFFSISNICYVHSCSSILTNNKLQTVEDVVLA